MTVLLIVTNQPQPCFVSLSPLSALFSLKVLYKFTLPGEQKTADRAKLATSWRRLNLTLNDLLINKQQSKLKLEGLDIFNPAGSVLHGDCTTPPLLHGLLLLDAGGGPAALEQSRVCQH